MWRCSPKEEPRSPIPKFLPSSRICHESKMQCTSGRASGPAQRRSAQGCTIPDKAVELSIAVANATVGLEPPGGYGVPQQRWSLEGGKGFGSGSETTPKFRCPQGRVIMRIATPGERLL